MQCDENERQREDEFQASVFASWKSLTSSSSPACRSIDPLHQGLPTSDTLRGTSAFFLFSASLSVAARLCSLASHITNALKLVTLPCTDHACSVYDHTPCTITTHSHASSCLHQYIRGRPTDAIVSLLLAKDLLYIATRIFHTAQRAIQRTPYRSNLETYLA